MNLVTTKRCLSLFMQVFDPLVTLLSGGILLTFAFAVINALVVVHPELARQVYLLAVSLTGQFQV